LLKLAIDENLVTTNNKCGLKFMIFYFILLALIMLLLYTPVKNTGAKSSDLGIYISVTLLTLFAGFRNRSVGTDTNNYIGFFENRSAYNFSNTSIERGFLVLEEIARFVSTNYSIFLTLIALVCVVSYTYLIKKESLNISISFFLYLTLGSYLFFFNGARQGIAASILAIAFVFLLKRKLFWFVFWVLVASLFHRTVLIMLPFYYILILKYSTFRMFLFSVTSFVGLSFLSFFISFFDEVVSVRYSAYIDRDASGGVLLGLFFSVSSLLLIYLRNRIPKEIQKIYDIYLNLCVFNSLIYLVVIVLGVDVNFLRFSQYFLAGYVLIWPLIFKYTPLGKDRVFKNVFYIAHLGFYIVYLSKMSSMIPFILNLELFAS
jgi:transmembrane protein EpsG